MISKNFFIYTQFVKTYSVHMPPPYRHRLAVAAARGAIRQSKTHPQPTHSTNEPFPKISPDETRYHYYRLLVYSATVMSKNSVGTSLIGVHNLLPPDMNRVKEPYKNLWEQVPMSLYVPAALLVYSLCSSFSGGKLCSSEDLVGTWIKLWHAKISVRTDILCNKIGIPSIFCRVSKENQSCNAIFDYSVEEIHTQLFIHKKLF